MRTASASASAAWQMPSCWTALGSTRCNLHKALLVTDMGRQGQRWREGASGADGCDERKVIQNDGRTGRASGEHWSSKSQPDFPGEQHIAGRWMRVDNLTADVASSVPLTIWFPSGFISQFLSTTFDCLAAANRFTRRRAGDLRVGATTWYRSDVIVWRHICRSPPFSERSDSVSPSPTNLLVSSSVVDRSSTLPGRSLPSRLRHRTESGRRTGSARHVIMWRISYT